jgi:hypothetical protein
MERSAERSRDSAYFTGGRDCENASTKCAEDPVRRAWGLWTTYAISWVTREGEGWAVVDTILCLNEVCDSGEWSENLKQFGGTN